MAVSAQDLLIRMKAKDEASKTIDGVGKKLGGLGKFAALGAAGGVAALAGLGIAAVKLGGDFADAYKDIAVGTGATGKELEGLKGDFKAVFSAIPTDMKSASAAIADFATLTGASGKVLQDLSKSALEAGRLMKEETGPIIKGVGKAMAAWEIPATQGAKLMDALFVASQKSGASMTVLTKNLQVFGPVLKNLGFSIEESIALFGSLNSAGLDVTRIMPGINMAMRKLADEGVTDLKGAMYDTIEAIKGAATESEALNIATKLFGAEGAQRMVVAIRTGKLELKEFTAALTDAEGAIADTAKETDDWRQTLQVLKQDVMVKLEPLLTALFEGLTQALIVAIPYIDDAFEAIGHVWDVAKKAWDAIDALADKLGIDLVAVLKEAIKFFMPLIRIIELINKTAEVFGGKAEDMGRAAHNVGTEVSRMGGFFADAGQQVADMGKQFEEPIQATKDLGLGIVGLTWNFMTLAAVQALQREATEKGFKPIGTLSDLMDKLSGNMYELRNQTEDTGGAMASGFDPAVDAARALQEAISGVRSRMDDLLGMAFVGETGFADQIFMASQEIKKLQLALLEAGGRGAEGTDELTTALEAARTNMEKLRLERDLTFDPMRRTVERIADPIKEITFQGMIDGIIGAKSELLSLAGEAPAAIEAFRSQAVLDVGLVADSFGLVVEKLMEVERQVGGLTLISYWQEVRGDIDKATEALGSFYQTAAWYGPGGQLATPPLPQISGAGGLSTINNAGGDNRTMNVTINAQSPERVLDMFRADPAAAEFLQCDMSRW